MSREPTHPNPFRRYALAGAAYLADAEEERYVRVAPDEGGFVVDHGALAAGSGGDEGPMMVPNAPVERFGGDQLAGAVQRACALAAAWLGFDEWEVEQAHRLFLAPKDEG